MNGVRLGTTYLVLSYFRGHFWLFWTRRKCDLSSHGGRKHFLRCIILFLSR